MEAKSYDLIVVSSSPAMVLEALKHEKAGLSVGIFDERERIGGAWYVKDLFGYKNVEVGCHFIYNDNAVYDFLNKIDSFKLEKMDPQPSIIISGLKKGPKEKRSRFANFKLAIKSFLFKDRKLSCRQMQVITGIRETFQHKSPKKFFQGLKRFFKYTPYRYFKKGCGEFMENIQNLVDNSTLEMHYNARVKDVNIDPGKGGEVIINGELVKFKKLLLSKHVKFDSLNIHEKIEYERTPWRKKHFVLNIKGQFTKKFTYVDVVNDPVLKRVSDVGAYCEGIDEEHVLVCCDTTEEIDEQYKNEEIKELIFNRLKELKFINSEAKLRDHFVEKFVSDYTPKEKLQELCEETKGVIFTIDTGDLGKSFKEYKDNWSEVVK
jgi:hypothetical protein